MVFTVTLSAVTDQTVTVNFATADGSAVAGQDYIADSGKLTFAPGDTKKNITVLVVGDTVIEPDEKFTVILSNPVNATISGSTGEGTIYNNDFGGSLHFSGYLNNGDTEYAAVNVVRYAVKENAGSAVITVARDNSTLAGVSVDYSTADGTAIAGQDYTAASGTLTFGANETSKTFTIPITDNAISGTSKTVNLVLSNIVGGGFTSPSRAVLIIVDDDTSLPTLSINDVSFSEGDNRSKTAFIFTVVLAGTTNQTATVSYATADGTAQVPLDYYPASGSLSFAPGDIAKTITVLVNGNVLVEPDETFTVNLSSAVNAAITKDKGTGTILNDDVSSERMPPCQIFPLPISINIGAEASSGNKFSVLTEGGVYGCYFSTFANNSFITINSSGGDSGIGGTVTFSVAANTGAARTGTIHLGGYYGSSESFDATITINQAAAKTIAAKKVSSDFDGDGQSDISVFRPSNGYWYISKSSGGYSFIQWGQSGDVPVPGDYDGDGKTDIAVYREFAGIAPPEGVDTTWYILRSSDNTFYSRQWGRNTPFLRNAAVPADYDGDGKTDLAVYTLSDAVGGVGNFQILQSSNNTGIARQWGYNTDIRVPRDYDGDGKTDLAVVRNGIWYILQSSNNALRVEYFGLSSDRFVPKDYDGDGKADIAVWRPSNGVWYRVNSADNSFVAYQFGLSTDTQVPADYDGDGKTDIAVFRPATGVWYLQQSSKGFRAEQFGLSGDIPVPNVFVR